MHPHFKGRFLEVNSSPPRVPLEEDCLSRCPTRIFEDGHGLTVYAERDPRVSLGGPERENSRIAQHIDRLRGSPSGWTSPK